MQTAVEHRRRLDLTGGGTDGNERLTAMTGTVLIVLLAVLGVTILRIGQLIWLHLFLGLLLLGPLAVKLGSTGYRFVRYYTGDPAYREKGPPELLLRLIAPMVVLLTLVVFASGVVLMIVGPDHRDPYLLVHKASFIVWLGFTGLHVLGHLPTLSRALSAARAERELTGAGPGASGRMTVLVGGLLIGLLLALVLIPEFSSWTANAAAFHHHHDH